MKLYKKYVSEFVKNQRILNFRIRNILLWDSQQLGTYVKRKHGELIKGFIK